jgi:hypothetical protein
MGAAERAQGKFCCTASYSKSNLFLDTPGHVVGAPHVPHAHEEELRCR